MLENLNCSWSESSLRARHAVGEVDGLAALFDHGISWHGITTCIDRRCCSQRVCICCVAQHHFVETLFSDVPLHHASRSATASCNSTGCCTAARSRGQPAVSNSAESASHPHWTSRWHAALCTSSRRSQRLSNLLLDFDI